MLSVENRFPQIKSSLAPCLIRLWVNVSPNFCHQAHLDCNRVGKGVDVVSEFSVKVRDIREEVCEQVEGMLVNRGETEEHAGSFVIW